MLIAAGMIARECGLAAVTVDAVTRAIGRTRGVFYVYFADRHSMLRQAISGAFDHAAQGMVALPGEGARFWSRVADRFLSTGHLDNPGVGCPIAALANEIARDAQLQKTFGTSLESYVDALVQRSGARGRARGTERRRALAIVAACAGAVSMARALPDEESRLEVLGAVREMIASI